MNKKKIIKNQLKYKIIQIKKIKKKYNNIRNL